MKTFSLASKPFMVSPSATTNHCPCEVFFGLLILTILYLTETQRNGGDDKSKNVERNPSNILPGNGYAY